ncbi:MAG: hypothetical protein WCB63_03805, partial [Polyangiales bacterium]
MRSRRCPRRDIVPYRAAAHVLILATHNVERVNPPLLLLGALGCGPDDPFVPEAYGQWLKFEPEGVVCANGSQYKYFVNFSETSSNLIVFLEGDGACSNYESCASGGPFNTDCIKEPAGTECIRDNYPAV